MNQELIIIRNPNSDQCHLLSFKCASEFLPCVRVTMVEIMKQEETHERRKISCIEKLGGDNKTHVI